MPVIIQWPQITLRLALTVLAGFLIGFNRGERGRPAGIRTTLLVCLAASIAMIQANLLMNTVGRAHDSFITLDLMRLPLGILCGIGFIGAGAIMRRDNLVVGVTTAATLWFTTIMGLCFGGGQISLGLAALALGMAVIWGLKYGENLLRRDTRAVLTILTGHGEPGEDDIRQTIERGGCDVVCWGVSYNDRGKQREICCEVERRARPASTTPPAFVSELANHAGVSALRWLPQGIPISAAALQTGPRPQTPVSDQS